jgi:hypothetical protein
MALDPEDELDPDEEPSERESRGFVTEWVRKLAVAGMGAIFMTEEGLRSLASQLKLPKEALAFILAQAEKTKGEISRVITDEIRRFLQSEKLREEFLKLLSQMTIEVKAEVRLKPDSGEPKVEVTELNARRARRGGKKD